MQTEFFRFVEKMASISETDENLINSKYYSEYKDILGKSFNCYPAGGLFFTSQLFRLMIRAYFKIHYTMIDPSALLLIRAIAKITKQSIYIVHCKYFMSGYFICNKPLEVSAEDKKTIDEIIKIIDEDGKILSEAHSLPQLAHYFNQESLLDEALSILL